MGGLSEIFIGAVITSCVGGLFTLLLIALRPLTSRLFGYTWQYYIYLAALVIMLVPISFGSSYSPYPEPIETEEAEAQPDVVVTPETEENADVGVTDIQPTVAPETENRATIYAVNVVGVLKYIWLAGTAVFLIGAAVSYARFKRLIGKNSTSAECALFDEIKLQIGIKRKIVLKRSTLTDAPLMVGMIRPTLILPEADFTETELRHVFMHELMHCKRLDLCYKLFALIVNALHWFNPLAYLLVRRINEDCEISCDTAVTKRMSESEKKAYMRTIVNLMTEKGGKSYV